MKTIQIIFGVLIVSLLAVIALNPNGRIINFGGLEIASFYTNATNSSSSVPMVATVTSPILSLDTARTNAMICNNGAYTVFLHQKGQSTTTGVVLNEGIPLRPFGLTTSTVNSCVQLPGFKGYLFGIASATTSVMISEWK